MLPARSNQAEEVEKFGVKALPFQLDVQDSDRMADLVATANKELGCVREKHSAPATRSVRVCAVGPGIVI